MKKLALLLAVLALPLSLAACKTTLHDDKVVIDGDRYGHPHGEDFCPPGQAKKGNC